MIRRGWKLRLAITILLLPVIYVSWAHLAMNHAAKQTPEQGIPNMLILGAGLRGETLSLSLLYRMEAALSYLRENPETTVIVSGGQGPGETVTEAHAMRRYLLEQGINPERIIQEDRSTSTIENIRFSKPLLSDRRVLIVTNDFHAYRAQLLAKRQGLTVQMLSAPTPQVVRTKMHIREYAAILKSLLLDW